jgi:hypothetical protein
MDGIVLAAEMVADVMDLGVAVVAAGDAVVGAGGHDLVELELAVGPPLLGVAGLEEAAAAAATVVVRLVRRHLDDILLADDRFYDEAEVIGDGVAEALADDLAGILDRELDTQLLVPVGVDLQAPLADPPGVVLID